MKKYIAFLLALLLLVSALPFAGAAFTDEKSINASYKKAVAAMAEKGIINGFTDGSFGPKKTLTRAQAAKILCVMLEGTEKTDALTKTETGFKDVPASHWAAKFVAYCADKGLVAGVGNGKFDPDGQLSTAAFAKMLLVAYGEDGAKFTGEKWADSVAEAAKPTFLVYKMESAISTKKATRQEAAQLAFNAMYQAEAFAAADKKDLSGSLPTAVPEKLKVLAIGNSGSNDCLLQHFYELMKSVGVKELTVGNLYHSGCRLMHHVDFALQDAKEYTYYKNTSGEWVANKNSTLEQAVMDEDWDIITFQQGNARVGVESSYHPWQDILLYYVQSRRPNALFGWNLNWSLQDGVSKTAFFAQYDRNQLKMYEGIIRGTKNQVLPEKRYQFVIPVGTAIQNARSSYLGDTLNRDGQHLNRGGSYIAALTWACKLTGLAPEQFTYVPEQDVTPGYAAVAREAVANALAHPLEITQSKILTEPT